LLDPFGMDIEWDAIASLNDTKSDVWVLIPTGVIVNRLLDSAGELKYSSRLESFFGLSEQNIRQEFYRTEKHVTLFGESEVVRKIENPIHHIANLYIRQMKVIWKYVTEKPKVLYNRRNVPIYHFVFASNNPTARKIAGQIIQNA
jgi:three-Cys-motif partner protein